MCAAKEHKRCLSQDSAIARGWVAELNSIIRSTAACRPSRLLVLLNPKGGSGRAVKVWHQKAQPILRLAGEHARRVCE